MLFPVLLWREAIESSGGPAEDFQTGKGQSLRLSPFTPCNTPVHLLVPCVGADEA